MFYCEPIGVAWRISDLIHARNSCQKPSALAALIYQHHTLTQRIEYDYTYTVHTSKFAIATYI